MVDYTLHKCDSKRLFFSGRMRKREWLDDLQQKGVSYRIESAGTFRRLTADKIPLLAQILDPRQYNI